MPRKITYSTSDPVAEARAEGITDPVIFYLEQKCSHAQAIYRELHGSPMQPRQIALHTLGAIEKLPRHEAIRLLRQHCSEAGEFLGTMLRRPIPSQYSTVWLFE